MYEQSMSEHIRTVKHLRAINNWIGVNNPVWVPMSRALRMIAPMPTSDLDATEPTDAEWRAIVRHDLHQAQLI